MLALKNVSKRFGGVVATDDVSLEVVPGAGDLFSSFVKRRLDLASSSMAIGLDHIPESLFPLLASRLLLPLSILEVVVGATIFVVGATILSPVLFKLNLRDEPH